MNKTHFPPLIFSLIATSCCVLCILSPSGVTIMGFGLVICFIEHFQNVPTRNYDGLTEFHTPNVLVTVAHKVFSVCHDFTNRCVVTDPSSVPCFRTHVLAVGGWLSTTSYFSNCCLKTQGSLEIAAGPRYIASAPTAQRTALPTALLLLHACLLRPLLSNDHCLQNHYVAGTIV
jgi:hypothetical protein